MVIRYFESIIMTGCLNNLKSDSIEGFVFLHLTAILILAISANYW